jgi:hypothetical protein
MKTVTLAPRDYSTNARHAYVRHSPGTSTKMFPTAFHILSLKIPLLAEAGNKLQSGKDPK